tara:strand:- start:896 stop:1195 length:300 start_codon:yes stop_codon:yes gene_type:complete
MSKIKSSNLTKKDICKEVQSISGLPILYIHTILDDLIDLLKHTIKYKKTNIKNFGSFKTLVKNERIGRNPKNKVTYKIKSRKSLSFICSKYLAKKISNY